MPEDISARRQGRLLQRALLSALLLAALGIGTVSALAPGTTSAPSDDAMDRAFAVQVVAMTDEISSILNNWSEAAAPNPTSADHMNLRSVGLNLSARSRFWHDALDAMPVSARFADAKGSMLLGLQEFESAGNSTVQAMDLALAGDEAAAVPLILEAANHASKGGEYFATAKQQFPSSGATGTGRAWGKRYAVGNPGSYLGARSGANVTARVTVRPRAATGTDIKPGSRSYGIAPPAARSFARWYPAARWAAGIR